MIDKEILSGGEVFDLGEDFTQIDPFDDEFTADIFGEKSTEEKSSAQESKTAAKEAEEKKSADLDTEIQKKESEEHENEVQENTKATAVNVSKATQTGNDSEIPNPFDEAIAKAEEKQAASTKSSLTDKLPVFSYANATEEIVDPSKTFDALRNEKADDFPELDDAGAVSWKMVYGTITKSVPTPKKTTIAGLKKQIEDSKEFLESLKKAKGEIVCKIAPSVTAKKKGVISSYKGVFSSVEKAKESGKAIAFVPSDDGNVYEVRFNKIGTFIAKADKACVFDKVRVGFFPALPKIPYRILSEVISFFKAYVTRDSELEAMANVYWSFSDSKYYVHVPKQQVSKVSVASSLPQMDEDKFLLVMEIHSHNTMEAAFSDIDNRDERATRLYTVIGRFDKFFPDVNTRISVGGKFVEINPELVFENADIEYPSVWNDAVEKSEPSNKEVF